MSYYGDDTRWFVGRVISVNDPMELGRVRVRIFGIHSGSIEDIPEADLPWAQTAIPVTEGGSSGLGANVGIKEQAQVFGIFLDGKAYNWFLSKEGGDFTPEQSAGIVGNLLKESQQGGDINPLALNSSEGSFGIAQWNPARAAGNRLGKLKEFSRQNGLNYQSLEAQLQFITEELFTTEKKALQKIREAKTAEQGALAFEWFERPAGWTRTSRSLSAGDRIAFAEQLLEKMEIA